MKELIESERITEEALHTSVILAGEHWMRKVNEGHSLRSLDL